MKKLLLLILVGFSLTTVNAQDDLPKAIQDINKTIFNISRDIRGVNAKEFTTNKWTKYKVWIHDNQIKKIRFEESLANASTTTDFFFNYDRLISVKYFFTAYRSRGFKSQRKIKDSTVSRDSYFNYDELISQDYLIYEGQDTLFWGATMQREGYRLWKKHQNLLNFNPYKTMQYDSIVAYDFEGDGDVSIMNEMGELDKTAKNGVRLSRGQINLLIETVTDTTTYGRMNSACFMPHMGIVFYSNGKIVSTINICFACNYLISDVVLPARNYYTQTDGGDDYIMRIPRFGFSLIGRKKLKALCSDLGLEYCPKEERFWDKEIED